jgi:hypothetical protein
MATDPRAPRHYDLRVDGHLDRHWSGWFGGFAITHHDDGTTTLRGPVDDQAQLHGLLAKVRDLGATLIAVTPVDDPRRPAPGPA